MVQKEKNTVACFIHDAICPDFYWPTVIDIDGGGGNLTLSQ